jgi:hypothetical protein
MSDLKPLIQNRPGAAPSRTRIAIWRRLLPVPAVMKVGSVDTAVLIKPSLFDPEMPIAV